MIAAVRKRLTPGGQALRWQVLGVVVTQATTAVVTLFVARQTAPEEFAVWAVAAILVNAKSAVTLGLGQSLIVHRFKDDDEYRDGVTAATASTFVVALVLGVLAAVFAHPVAAALSGGAPSAAVVDGVRVISVALACLTLEDVPLSVIERRLDFRARATAEIAATSAYAVVACVLLFEGAGVWALIVGRVFLSVARLALFWSRAGVVPRLTWRVDRALFRALLGYGALLNAAALISFAVRNLDNVAAGWIAGTSGLGIYAFAFTVSNLVPNFLGDTVVRVQLPLVASVRSSPPAVRAAFGRALATILLLVVPTALVLATLGPTLVTEVFGRQWAPAAPVLRILAVYVVARACGHLVHALLCATGNARAAVAAHAAALVVSLALLWPLARFGASGVAAAFAAGQVAFASVAFARALPLLRSRDHASSDPTVEALLSSAPAG